MTAEEYILRAIIRGPIAPAGVLVAFNEFISQYVPEHPTAVEKTLLAYSELLEYIPRGFLITQEELTEAVNNPQTDFMSIPFHEILTDLREAIYNFVGTFFHREIRDLGLFKELREQLTDNENAASGISKADRVLGRGKVVSVLECDAPPEELIRLYLRHTPFYEFFLHTRVAFRIPKKAWSSHSIALGPSGAGKTQLLQCLCADFMRDPDLGFVFIDPHGDAFQKLVERVESSRLVVVDPDNERTRPSLNFLSYGGGSEAATLQTFSYLMSSLSGGLTDKQGAIVPYLLKLIKEVRGASLETLREIVDEKVKSPDRSTFAREIAKLPSVDRGFFHNQFYSSRMQETKDAIGWKLYSALSSDAFRQMFSANTNSLDFDHLIAERKVVIVKGGFDSLGEDGMRVFLQFLVAQYYAAGMRRLRLPERERHLNLFICDEASKILTSPLVAQFLFDLRKVNCGFLGASQVWDQVATDVKAAVLGNTAIKIVGPVQFSDASILSREMYTDPAFIRGMQRSDSDPFAPWAVYVNGMTKKAARVRVPFGVLEAMPKQRSDIIEMSPSQPVTAETGAPGTSETLPQEPQKAIKPELSDIELVITTTSSLETLFEAHCNAVGRGLHEKVTSAKDTLPAHVVRSAYHVAGMRNKVIHRKGYTLRNRGKLIRNAKLVEEYFARTYGTIVLPTVDLPIPKSTADDDHIRPATE